VAPRPVFIFSISRSGSTLLQRVLAAHEGVATVSEPWLLLPHAYSLRSRGVDAEYLHARMVEAIEDFCAELPGGRAEYERAAHDHALGLYERAAGPGARMFIDKSPPYCLVAEEIMRLFPEGRFVFLWRNPLSAVASMIETWPPWRPTMFRDELFVGLPRLIAAYERHRESSHAVRFEQLLDGTDAWDALTSYLGLDFDRSALSSFVNVRLNGRMGDPTGVHAYRELSPEPREKWRATMSNPLRREWCRRYLRFLGADRLAAMGYDEAELQTELSALPGSHEHLLGDLGQALKDLAKEPVRVRTRHPRVGGPGVIRELLRA
jgi:Sulfotransferase family